MYSVSKLRKSVANSSSHCWLIKIPIPSCMSRKRSSSTYSASTQIGRCLAIIGSESGSPFWVRSHLLPAPCEGCALGQPNSRSSRWIYGALKEVRSLVWYEKSCASWKFPTLCITWVRNIGRRLGQPNSALSPGLTEPIPDGKRDAFFKAQGRVQVPYLEDPNTGEGLFESARILDYLNAQYG